MKIMLERIIFLDGSLPEVRNPTELSQVPAYARQEGRKNTVQTSRGEGVR